jgi:hypothetical protein
MLNCRIGSKFVWVWLTVLAGVFLLGWSEVHAQQNRGRVIQSGYYNGLGGRVVNPSHYNLGGFAGSGRHYTQRYSTSTWGPQYNQWTNWRATPYHQQFPNNSLIWGQSHGVRSYGTGRYYGTRFQVNQTSYYNPYGQTRWYW